MTREEFKSLVKAMKGAYHNCPITTQEIFNLWYEMLKDLSYGRASASLRRHIRTCKYAPTIAEIRGSDRFNNFVGRDYDMDKLEAALLEQGRPVPLEKKPTEDYYCTVRSVEHKRLE